MMAGGVFAGAKMPKMDTASYPGSPVEATVGMSGYRAEGCALVTASARNLPDFTCGEAALGLVKDSCVCPAMRELMAGPTPLKGTRTMSTPAMALNKAPARCEAVPLWPLASFSTPGLALATAMRSLMELMGWEGWTTTMLGEVVARVMGAKSRSASQGTSSRISGNSHRPLPWITMV